MKKRISLNIVSLSVVAVMAKTLDETTAQSGQATPLKGGVAIPDQTCPTRLKYLT